MAQRVVIPKGLINPNETTIVEIPAQFKNVSSVVARIKGSEGSGHEPKTPPPRTVKKRIFRRRTAPYINEFINREPRGDGYTFGGRDYDDATPASTFHFSQIPQSPHEMSYGNFNPTAHSSPRHHRADSPSHGPHSTTHHHVSQIPQSPHEMSYANFNPTAHSSFQDMDYNDFKPGHSSSRHHRADSPSHGPHSTTHHQSTPSQVMKKTSVTRTSPTEYSQEETEESYYDESSGLSSSGPMFEMSGSGSSGGYQQFSGVDDGAKGYQQFSGIEPSNLGSLPLSADEMSYMLSQIESQEQEQIMQDMSSYQEARRKLLLDASSLASAADVSARIMGANTV